MGEGLGDGYEKVVETLGFKETEERPFWAKYLKSEVEPEKPNFYEGVVAVLDGDKDIDDFAEEQEVPDEQIPENMPIPKERPQS